jgi:hypothetical protein
MATIQPTLYFILFAQLKMLIFSEKRVLAHNKHINIKHSVFAIEY